MNRKSLAWLLFFAKPQILCLVCMTLAQVNLQGNESWYDQKLEGRKNLSEFENDQGISEIIGVKVAPSFFVVNPEGNHVHPVGAGLLSLSEL